VDVRPTVLEQPLSNLIRLDLEKTLYLIIILLALVTRLWGLGDQVASHDESVHARFSWDLYTGRGLAHSPWRHGPFLYHVTALSYFFFGDDDFTARLPVALMGVLLVASPWLLRRWLGRAGALVTSFFLLISPSIAYYSRYIRHDVPIMLWFLLVIWAIFSYLRDGRERWLYVMAAGISLMFATKEVAFIYNAILGFFLVGLFVVEVWKRERSNEGPRALRSMLTGAWRELRTCRVFALVITLGTLCLPFLSPVLILAAGLDPTDYAPPTIYYSGAITGVMFLLSVGVGLWWNWRRWSVAAAIHYAIFLILFTTVFTNGTGIATGMIGSLGYWLPQQEVERGSQPVCYYVIMVLLYEFLPLLLAFVASIYGVVRTRRRSSRFILFLLWWSALSWIGYSLAGERMPWMTVHIVLPMILLSGWLIGRLIEGTDWQRLIRLAWRSGRRVMARVLLLGALFLPMLLTIRAAYRFCYINYDYPTEFLVYAHAAPAVNETMRQIDKLSRRIAGGPNLIEFAYGSGDVTLWHWQVRNYPNAVYYGEKPSRQSMNAPVVIAGRDQWEGVTPYLARDYVFNTYAALWWPMEDYRDLSWARRAITDTQFRAALWDIWYDRDYCRYGELTGKTHTLDQWPQRSEFRLYVRRDVAAQMWDLGAISPQGGAFSEVTDPYAEGWRDLTVRRVFGEPGSDPGQLERPSGITIGPNGFVYVADTGNHRVQKFTADGQFVAAWGRHSTLETEIGGVQGFNEPGDVAIAPDGSVYVADTWNHRIHQLDGTGNLVNAWGTSAQYDPGDGAVGEAAFYGPRGIAVGPDGRIYVTDTGNKRVQVFGPDGRFVFQWGGGGVLEGYLDEPVGIALGSDGAVYVADTWNQRVQVFDAGGAFLRQWAIAGWDSGMADEKPYLAVDAAGYVYVTDPGRYRVLVFDSWGDYLLSFGQYGSDERSFTFPSGIAVAEDGSIYVTDSHSGRVLVFDSLALD
jgi:uncharacterized protein (TIGR03663 family)